jgi:hypothetical protein
MFGGALGGGGGIGMGGGAAAPTGIGGVAPQPIHPAGSAATGLTAATPLVQWYAQAIKLSQQWAAASLPIEQLAPQLPATGAGAGAPPLDAAALALVVCECA